MHSQIIINHTSQQSESLTMANCWVQNDNVFFRGVETDTICRSPFVNIFGTFVQFCFDIIYWQRTIKLLENNWVISKQFLLVTSGLRRECYVAKKSIS